MSAKPGNTNASKGLKGGPRITIRGNAAEHAQWQSAATGRKLSDWIREKLNHAAAEKNK